MKVLFTWRIMKEMALEHDGLVGRWVRYIKNNCSVNDVRFYHPEGSLPEARVLVLEFRDIDKYRVFFDICIHKDPYHRYRDSWLKMVRKASVRVYYWGKIEDSLAQANSIIMGF